MSNLYLLQWNTYGNRKIEKYDTISEYRDASTHSLYFANINFKIGDGVNATQVINLPDTYTDDTLDYTYLLVYESADGVNTITSRWWVMEASKVRDRQWQLTLYRDLIADNYDAIVDAPCYIKKGIINSKTPAIYNREGMEYNQIATNQAKLFDNTQNEYYVMYIDRDKLFAPYLTDPSVINDETYVKCTQRITGFDIAEPVALDVGEILYIANDGFEWELESTASNPVIINANFAMVSREWKQVKDYYDEDTCPEPQLSVLRLGNIMAFVGDVKGISSIVTDSGEPKKVSDVNWGQNTMAITSIYKSNPDDKQYGIVIPKETTTINGTITTSDRDIVPTLYMMLGDLAYDCQLLPYCPEYASWDGSTFRTANMTAHANKCGIAYARGMQIVDMGGAILTDNLEFDELIPAPAWMNNIPTVAGTTDIDWVETKVLHETEFCDIVDPHRDNPYRFSPIEYKGVSQLHVYATYKPYAPYIRINPVYGNNANLPTLVYPFTHDNNGCICSGDYSIDRYNDAWVNYKLQNRNYQAIFDREVDSLNYQYDVQQSAEMRRILASLALGAVGMAAGGVGAVAAAGAAVNGVNSILSYQDREKLHENAMDTASDKYELSLGNIKSRPRTITKSSGYNIDEEGCCYAYRYTASDEEKQALREKIKYDGMRINMIGKISDYQSEDELRYVCGDIIRLDIPVDTHEFNTIKNEIAKGVYI